MFFKISQKPNNFSGRRRRRRFKTKRRRIEQDGHNYGRLLAVLSEYLRRFVLHSSRVDCWSRRNRSILLHCSHLQYYCRFTLKGREFKIEISDFSHLDKSFGNRNKRHSSWWRAILYDIEKSRSRIGRCNWNFVLSWHDDCSEYVHYWSCRDFYGKIDFFHWKLLKIHSSCTSYLKQKFSTIISCASDCMELYSCLYLVSLIDWLINQLINK